MTKKDREALNLAMDIYRAESPVCSQHLAAKLKDESWEEVARFAASHCQSQALNLFPWQDPPCWGTGCIGFDPDPDAVRLLEKMLAHGVSRWHPDPLAAIEAAKAKGAA